MLNFQRSASLLLCAFLSAAGLWAADTYQVDPVHSTVHFRIKHLNVSFFHGRIKNPSGTVVIDEGDAAKCQVEMELKVENIDSGNEKLDLHLKSADFFNAKQFPAITFKSKAVKKADEAIYEVTGDLSLLGVSKELTVKMTRTGSGSHPKVGSMTGFEGVFSIKRSEFGMKYMPEGLGEEVQITISTEVVKKEK